MGHWLAKARVVSAVAVWTVAALACIDAAAGSGGAEATSGDGAESVTMAATAAVGRASIAAVSTAAAITAIAPPPAPSQESAPDPGSSGRAYQGG